MEMVLEALCITDVLDSKSKCLMCLTVIGVTVAGFR